MSDASSRAGSGPPTRLKDLHPCLLCHELSLVLILLVSLAPQGPGKEGHTQEENGCPQGLDTGCSVQEGIRWAEFLPCAILPLQRFKDGTVSRWPLRGGFLTLFPEHSIPTETSLFPRVTRWSGTSC